jgi:hypothetical protein
MQSLVLHAECAFYTHTRISWTRMGMNMTLTSVIFTRLSVIFTRIVTSTGTNVIPTRTRLISTRRVRFPHAECDFLRRVWFPLTQE